MESEKRREQPDDTDGGFNPDRARKSEKPQVGPVPTDDPNIKVKSKKPKVDPALKPTAGEKSERKDADAFPSEGAVRNRRGDKEQAGL